MLTAEVTGAAVARPLFVFAVALAAMLTLIALELRRFWVPAADRSMSPTALHDGQCSPHELLRKVVPRLLGRKP
jgi:hypothetical protein